MTRSWWWAVPLALVGLATGALLTLTAAPAPLTTVEEPPAQPSESDPITAAPVKVDAGVLLVWTAGGLPDRIAAAVSSLDQVNEATVVYGDRVDLAASTDVDGRKVDAAADGWAWPLDALAVDPAQYGRFVTKASAHVIADLSQGEAILGSTSAELRRLGAGGALTLTGGAQLDVVAVVDDSAVAAAEVVTDLATGRRIGVTTPRFLLVTYDGDRAGLEQAIRDATPPGDAVRIRTPGETPFLRHGDAVLPQALVKHRFGEFSYRPPTSVERFRQEPGWQEANIVAVDLPLVGTTRCHRAVVQLLEGALAELEAEGLDHLVDPEGFAGCHNPRLIAPGGPVSRHAWGVAVDLNAGANPTGTGSAQDPRLVETFARWGFTWGGFWLVPDPMHFEYLRPPELPAD